MRRTSRRTAGAVSTFAAAAQGSIASINQPAERAKRKLLNSISPACRPLQAKVWETLEERRMLSVLPAPPPSDPFNISFTLRGNESAPQVAVDLNDPKKLFAVYQINDPANDRHIRQWIGASFST